MWIVRSFTEQTNHVYSVRETKEEAKKDIEEIKKFLEDNKIKGYSFKIENCERP